jgi:hypothetical protein
MKSFLTFISEADGNPSLKVKAGNPVSKPEVKKPAQSSSPADRVARTKPIPNLTEDPLSESEDFIKTLERMVQSGGDLTFRSGQTAKVPSEYIRRAIALYNRLGDRGERLAFSKRLRSSPGDFKAAIKFTGN